MVVRDSFLLRLVNLDHNTHKHVEEKNSEHQDQYRVQQSIAIVRLSFLDPVEASGVNHGQVEVFEALPPLQNKDQHHALKGVVKVYRVGGLPLASIVDAVPLVFDQICARRKT